MLRQLAVLALMALPRLAAGQAFPPDSQVFALIREQVDAGRYAGITVGFITADGEQQVTAYGPRAGVTPFDGNTVFEIGSITKTMTAVVLADMVREGKVALDDPVQKHLPAGTVIPKRNEREITLLDLATQTSGLPRLPANLRPVDIRNPYAGYTSQELFTFLSTYTLTRDIGAQYEYSNLGFGLLGEALSNRGGATFEQLIQARIFEPLGMADSRVTLTSSMKSRLAPGHAANGDSALNWDFRALAATGAVRSTVNDMLRYLRANVDSTHRPRGLVMAATLREQRPGPNASTTMGLAWHRTRLPSGSLVIWHNGGTGGYRSFAGLNRERGVAVVVLTNTATSVDELGIRLLELARGRR